MWIAVLYNTVEHKETGFASELVAENEIVATARGVVEALRGPGSGHEVVTLRANAAMLARIARSPFDVVFNLAEGLGGRAAGEHLVPALLDAVEMPYTGADGTAIALCRDKALAKRLLAAAGLPTPAWQLFERADAQRRRDLVFPVIVKPAYEDASIGITAESVVRDEASLRRQVAHVLERYREAALVERFVEGREINCALLGNGADLQALPLAEITFRHSDGHPSIVTFESKWIAGSEADRAQLPVCPADLPPGLAAEIVAAARAAFEATGCRDYARVDFRLESDAGGAAWPQIIDVNPNPAIDEGAGLARSARAAGIAYPDLIARIVAMAAERGRAAARPRAPAPRRPVVAGRRLRLEPPAPRHLAELARWFSDEESGRYMDDPGSTCTEEEIAEAFFAGREDVDFVACDQETGEPVGYCGLYAIANRRAQITFFVGERSRRGQGLGREMAELLIDAAFDEVGLEAVEASVVAENEPSLRLCRSLGFREIGRRRGSHRLGERRLDEILLELSAPEPGWPRGLAPAAPERAKLRAGGVSMKRALMAPVLALCALAAWSQAPRDGIYFAQADDFDKSGWRAQVVLEARSGKIVRAVWNGVSNTGASDKVAECRAGRYGMIKISKTGKEWHEQAALVEKYLLDTQSVKFNRYTGKEGETDAISGASIGVREFFVLADKALAAGPVARGAYARDGWYYAADAAFDASTGWKDNALVTVVNGRVVDVVWNAVHKDGGASRMVRSLKNAYGMPRTAKGPWHQQAGKVLAAMLQQQSPSKFAVKADGRTDAVSGVSITVGGFFRLVTEALKSAN